jgi:hypothetical protein
MVGRVRSCILGCAGAVSVVGCLAVAVPVTAQEVAAPVLHPPSLARTAPSSTAAPAMDSAERAAAYPPDVRGRLRRGRILTMIGAPLAIVGGALAAGLLPQRCTDGSRVRTGSIGATLALGIGVGLTTGGAVSFLGVPLNRRRKHRVDRGRRTGLVLAGMAVGLVVGGALSFLGVMELAACSST